MPVDPHRTRSWPWRGRPARWRRSMITGVVKLGPGAARRRLLAVPALSIASSCTWAFTSTTSGSSRPTWTRPGRWCFATTLLLPLSSWSLMNLFAISLAQPAPPEVCDVGRLVRWGAQAPHADAPHREQGARRYSATLKETVDAGDRQSESHAAPAGIMEIRDGGDRAAHRSGTEPSRRSGTSPCRCPSTG